MSKLGEKALQYISDYPLYASTSNIGYDTAIRVANAVSPNWKKEMEYMEKFNKMTPEEQKIEAAKWQ